MTTTNTNLDTLRQTLGNAGFVHRRLDTRDVRSGNSYVPSDQFDAVLPNVIVTVDEDATYLTVSNTPETYEHLYSIRFDVGTPAAVQAAAIIAARDARK